MSRDIKLLHPKLQLIIPQLIKKCSDNGITIKILDTLRNKTEQDIIPSANTNAKYPNSMHNWGVAFDYCIIINGKIDWNTPLYKKVGETGKSLGLFWGGDFKSIKGDYGHFQLKEYGTMPKEILIPKYKTPENFINSWNEELNEQHKEVSVVTKEEQELTRALAVTIERIMTEQPIKPQINYIIQKFDEYIKNGGK